MENLDNIAEEIAGEYNSNREPGFDIILAFTIGKIIFDVIVMVMKCYSKDAQQSYFKFQNLTLLDKVMINRIIKKHCAKEEVTKIRKLLLSKKIEMDRFSLIFNEILEKQHG